MTERHFHDWKVEGTLSLTTYYKNGKGVATPVGYARKGDKIFVNTDANSYKIKRLKNNPSGQIALSTMRGKLRSPLVDVKVRILPPGADAETRETMKLDNKLMWNFMKLCNRIAFWRKASERIFLEIEKG